jgi:hypothetical protein
VRGRSYRQSQPSGRMRHNLRPTVADHVKAGQSGPSSPSLRGAFPERRLTTTLTADPTTAGDGSVRR